MCVQVLVHSICIIYSYRLTHLLFSFAVQVTAPSSILLSLYPSLLIFCSQTHTPFVSAAQCSERTKKKSIIARFPFSPPPEQSNSRGSSSSTNSQVYRFYWRSSSVAAAAAAPFSIVVVADQIPTCVWPLQRAQDQCECCGGHTCMVWCKQVCMYLYVSPPLPWWDGVGIVAQLASTFFFTLSDCFLCPSLLLRWCCCGVSVPVSSRFRFDSSKNYNFTTTCTEYTHTHTCIHVIWCMCVCLWVCVKCKVRWGKVYAARRSSAVAVTAVDTAAAAAAVAAKCNRGSVVASYSSVWFLIFSFVDFVMYCNIAVAWTRMPVCVCAYIFVGVFSSHLILSLSFCLLSAIQGAYVAMDTLLPSLWLWSHETPCVTHSYSVTPNASVTTALPFALT